MLFWAILVFVVWIAALQLIRSGDRRVDAEHRLAARRRVRAVARRQRQDQVPPEQGERPTDDRPLASPEYEQDALSRFRLDLSAEEFAARFGHHYALFQFDKYRYRTPGMTEWVDQLSAFFFAPDLQARLRAAREKYLSEEELAKVEAFERDPF